jgi:hypothetical protein
MEGIEESGENSFMQRKSSLEAVSILYSPHHTGEINKSNISAFCDLEMANFGG